MFTALLNGVSLHFFHQGCIVTLCLSVEIVLQKLEINIQQQTLNFFSSKQAPAL